MGIAACLLSCSTSSTKAGPSFQHSVCWEHGSQAGLKARIMLAQLPSELEEATCKLECRRLNQQAPCSKLAQHICPAMTLQHPACWEHGQDQKDSQDQETRD